MQRVRYDTRRCIFCFFYCDIHVKIILAFILKRVTAFSQSLRSLNATISRRTTRITRMYFGGVIRTTGISRKMSHQNENNACFLHCMFLAFRTTKEGKFNICHGNSGFKVTPVVIEENTTANIFACITHLRSILKNYPMKK